jgi:signal peptidase II
MNKLVSPAIILALFMADRASKAWAFKSLYGRSVEVLSFFRLTWAENTGVAFGMFRDSNMFFLAFSAALVAVLLFLRRRIERHGAVAAVGLALVLGGALGNMFDRIAYGFVVDYFDFSFFPAIFNVADSGITVGAVLMALGMKDEKKAGHKMPGVKGNI